MLSDRDRLRAACHPHSNPAFGRPTAGSLQHAPRLHLYNRGPNTSLGDRIAAPRHSRYGYTAAETRLANPSLHPSITAPP